MALKYIYGYPSLPKAGLANMLIPWAECQIFCQDYGVKRIAPNWRKIRLGPFIRGERDKRQYQHFFTNSGNISGLKRQFLLAISKRMSVEDFHSDRIQNHTYRPVLICFSDMNHLGRLIGRHNEVVNELYRITKTKYWPTGLPKKYIGIHIRMGDFPQKLAVTNPVYFRQPLEWYIQVLNKLRKTLACNTTAIIFSDGTDEELLSILEMDNVTRSPFSESITDLLALAKSSVIITSRSSFSLFAAFLGQVPSIWYQGKSAICQSGYMPKSKSLIQEVEWMPGQDFPDPFILSLDTTLRNTSLDSNSYML